MIRGELPVWVAVLVIGRDVYLAIGAAIIAQVPRASIDVVIIGKVTTALLMFGFCDLLLGMPVIDEVRPGQGYVAALAQLNVGPGRAHLRLRRLHSLGHHRSRIPEELRGQEGLPRLKRERGDVMGTSKFYSRALLTFLLVATVMCCLIPGRSAGARHLARAQRAQSAIIVHDSQGKIGTNKNPDVELPEALDHEDP